MEIIESIKKLRGSSSKEDKPVLEEPVSVGNATDGIRERIKRNAADAHHIREQIYAAKGIDRHNLWNEKRSLGSNTRIWLLAYGCLRGRPYPTIEGKCALGNDPYPSDVLMYIQTFLGREGPEAESWTKDRVKAWLKRPEPAKMASEGEEEAA